MSGPLWRLGDIYVHLGEAVNGIRVSERGDAAVRSRRAKPQNRVNGI